MCLIVFAHKQHPDYHLILAANRDGFYERPTRPAAFWNAAPEMLAGKDLQAGGTWMGLTRFGRFAALTNYRDSKSIIPEVESRGTLVTNYLTGRNSPQQYLENIDVSGRRYNVSWHLYLSPVTSTVPVHPQSSFGKTTSMSISRREHSTRKNRAVLWGRWSRNFG